MNGNDPAGQIIDSSLAGRAGSLAVSERRQALQERVASLLSGLAMTCGGPRDPDIIQAVCGHGWVDWHNGWIDWPNGQRVP